MTAPRWIVEALEAERDMRRGEGQPDPHYVATALIERLPIEAMARSLAMGPDSPEIVARIVRVLTDGDPEVVELAELYQGASRMLDAAGVPYELALTDDGDPQVVRLNLAGRILWLVEQRPTRLDLQRVEAERDAARRDYQAKSDQCNATRADAQLFVERLAGICGMQICNNAGDVAQRVIRLVESEHELDEARDALTSALEERDSFRRERDQLRKMYEGASADLDRERREHQEAEGAAANREIGLRTALEGARERFAALEGEVEILRESLDSATGDAEHNERELVDLRRRFDDLQRERDRLARDLNQLQGDLDTAERKLRDAEREVQRARHPGSW